jgi:hypothetical protein
MGGLLSAFYSAMITRHIIAHHMIKGERKGLQHRLEDSIFKTLNWNQAKEIYVHWGAFDSGKSRSARNAAIRLQDTGKLAILLHGYDFVPHLTMRTWLQICMGIPESHADDKLCTFLPRSKQTVNQGLMYSTIKVRERHPRPHHEGATVFARG